MRCRHANRLCRFPAPHSRSPTLRRCLRCWTSPLVTWLGPDGSRILFQFRCHVGAPRHRQSLRFSLPRRMAPAFSSDARQLRHRFPARDLRRVGPVLSFELPPVTVFQRDRDSVKWPAPTPALHSLWLHVLQEEPDPSSSSMNVLNRLYLLILREAGRRSAESGEAAFDGSKSD